jgi:hypothetical protein
VIGKPKAQRGEKKKNLYRGFAQMNADQKQKQMEEYKQVVGTYHVLLIFLSASAMNPLFR